MKTFAFKSSRTVNALAPPMDMRVLETMRVIVRDAQSGKYYAGPRTWVSDPKHALNFEHGLRALAFCDSHRVFQLHIVYDFQDPAMNFEIAWKR
jgi:hypothetical protein